MASNKNIPRCKKCGRKLTDPVSIARGVGPVCAGLTGYRRRVRTRQRRSSGRAYDALGHGSGGQLSLFDAELLEENKPNKKNKTPAG